MRNLFIAFICLCLAASCSDKNDPQPAPSDSNETPQLGEKHWIPNWIQDTLYCMVPSDAGGGKDTLYSFSVKDTSMVRYKGKAYYLWTADNYFTPNAKTYTNSYISTKPFDAASALAGHILFVVEPGIFRSEYSGNLEKQEQTIEDRGMYTFPSPPFSEGIKTFSTKYKSW